MFVKEGLFVMLRVPAEVSACDTDGHICHSFFLLSSARFLDGCRHAGADSIRNFELVTCQDPFNSRT